MGPQADQFVGVHDAASTVSFNLPERITLEFEVADIGTRFYALLLDSVLRLMLQIGVLFVFGMLTPFLTLATRGRADWLVAVMVIALFLVEYGYFIVWEILTNGRTLGKLAFGLRVIKEDGSTLTRADILLRNLIRVFDSLPVLNALGLVVMLISPRAQRLGDLAARTIVIRERLALRAEWLARDAFARLPIPDATPLQGMRRFSPPDLLRIRDFLSRRPALSNAPALAAVLARDARARLIETAPEIKWMDDIALLERIDVDGRSSRAG